MPSWCDPRVRSRQSRRHDLGSGFAGEVEGCDLGVIRSLSQTAKLKGVKSKGSGFVGEVEGWDLGEIQSRSRTAKSKGAKSKGSRLWVRSLSGCDLSLSLRVSLEMV